MAYKIIWSPEAVETFDDIIDYLSRMFTQKEVAKFVGIVNRRLLLLQQIPQSFRATGRTSRRRRTVLHKRAILFYTVRERKSEVELLFFFNTRQNPTKANF
jgi:plasmid stabilization system protein ParE